ncbi:MAG: hypothetical protein CBD74_11110 [Saprospirales bacterium TMED214]|nr:MAG: hypothetical protein CBD74_11110 [Saprospirales bacterium TMED214]
MSLSNSEAIQNLTNQKKEIETQLESLRINYLKIIGAIDALTQIEASQESDVIAESEEEVSEEETE